MERYISNAEAKEIIDVEMTPSFSKRDLAGGLERGLNRLMEAGRRSRMRRRRRCSPSGICTRVLVSEIKRLGRIADDDAILERMRAIIVRQLGVRPVEVGGGHG
jgi:hypothetical protein